MKVAIGQMRVVAGDINANINVMKKIIVEAKSQQADLVVFPEMCVTGYFLGDRYHDFSFLEKAMEANEEIQALSQGIGVLYGNVYVDKVKRGEDGRKARYNAAYFFHNQQPVIQENGQAGVYFKHLLPNYRVFDDSRYFLNGSKSDQGKCSPFLFDAKDGVQRIGVEICEDLWSESYDIDVTKKYMNQNVDCIINISASPWTMNKEVSRDKQIQRYAKSDAFPYFLYVNQVGMQNTGKTICLFDGGSTLYAPDGKVKVSCNDSFNEEVKIIDFEMENQVQRQESKVLHALIYACKEVDLQWFNQKVKWIVGLSGGLDSAVSASLLVAALGKERVVAYNMASQYNRETTKSNARWIADQLGIELREGSIEKIVDSTISTTLDYNYQKADQGLVLENIQARIRGHLLSTFASLEGGVIVNNGNKVEIALGYCTLYGDSIGVFSPIGDCTKVQLFELAQQINEHFKKEVIPNNLVPQHIDGSLTWEMPPSAELKDEQLDPMKWFYHDWLISKLVEYPSWTVDDIIQSYEDKTLFNSEIGAWLTYYGLDNSESFYKDLEWVLSTMQKAVFKRVQSPPIVLISRGSFGTDFREVQGKFYQSLENKAKK